MRAIAIKMKSYTSHADIISGTSNASLLKGILITLGVLTVLYFFFLGNMVINIIERKSLEAEARTLSSEVADLELQYIGASNKVDLGLSHSLGFKETQGVFTTRKSLGSLKLEKNEI